MLRKRFSRKRSSHTYKTLSPTKEIPREVREMIVVSFYWYKKLRKWNPVYKAVLDNLWHLKDHNAFSGIKEEDKDP